MTHDRFIKKIMTMMVSGLILGLVSWPASAQVAKQDKKQITAVMHNYIKAIRDEDFSLLEKCFSNNYFKNHGGKDSWKKNLGKISVNYKNAAVEAVEIIPVKNKPGEYWGKIIIKYKDRKQEIAGNNWYLLAKDSSGKWKIDEFFADIDPYNFNEKTNAPKCENCDSDES
jgi:hypothetical protein